MVSPETLSVLCFLDLEGVGEEEPQEFIVGTVQFYLFLFQVQDGFSRAERFLQVRDKTIYVFFADYSQKRVLECCCVLDRKSVV